MLSLQWWYFYNLVQCVFGHKFPDDDHNYYEPLFTITRPVVTLHGPACFMELRVFVQ